MMNRPWHITRAIMWVAALLIAILCVLGSEGIALASGESASAPTLQVGTYYYPWYDSIPFGRELHWNQGQIEEPSLGRYSNKDPDVIGQHIAWAKEAGIDFFVMSWWGQGHYTDSALRYYHLRHPDAADVPVALFYEVKARFKDSRINYDDPINRAYLVRDFEYIAKTYFDDPAYLKFDGKPVVFIYLTRIFIGDYTTAINDVREAVRKLGYEIYIVGDEPYHGTPVIDRAVIFDAVSPYNMHTSSLPEDDWDLLISRTEAAYNRWLGTVSSLPQPVFFPNAMPGFNDWGVRPQEVHPRFFPSPERFRSSLELALEYVDPRMPVLLITSFNEWHEDTQIEPSEKWGTAYLETLRTVLNEQRTK